jgi:hypothetical protein
MNSLIIISKPVIIEATRLRFDCQEKAPAAPAAAAVTGAFLDARSGFRYKVSILNIESSDGRCFPYKG